MSGAGIFQSMNLCLMVGPLGRTLVLGRIVIATVLIPMLV